MIRPLTPPWTVIILTGGTGTRLGGADKATLDLGGSTPLETLLTSLPPSTPVIIVGDDVATSRVVAFTREDPPGGGPAAAIAAAVSSVRTPLVGIVAVDMPWAAPVLQQAVEALATDPDTEVVLPLDAHGRQQLLCSAWRTNALKASVAAAGAMAGLPVRHLLAGRAVRELAVHELAVPDLAADHLSDIDTPEDLARERQRVADRRLAGDHPDAPHDT